MTPSRVAILEEMGLGPVWRLRTPAEAEQKPAAVDEFVEHFVEPVLEPVEARIDHRASEFRVEEPLPVADDRAARIAEMDWPALKQTVAGCTACGLCKTRKNTVFGVGDEQAEWMIVGEAPGAEEDAKGEPFVGQAGRLLDNMLAALGLARDKNVYIANVLKCRPPGNRNPEPGEVAQCSPHLLRQIALIKPKLIVAMGRFAAQTLLNSDASIASMRGRRFEYHGVPLVVTYHPAYLLRTLPDKAKAWEDLCFARSLMKDLNERVAAPS